jgi:hypothetical protein
VPTKSINVPMEEALHRQFKAVSASLGVSEKDILLRSFIFANEVAIERVHAIIHDLDGNEIGIAGVMTLTLSGSKETRALLRSIDSLATRLRKLEAFTMGVASSRMDDYPDLKREASKLAKNGPWKDPKTQEA